MENRGINHGIYLKFNLLIVGTIFCCGMIIGGMLLQTTSKSLEDNLISTGEEIASALAVTVTNDILLDDRFSLQGCMNRMMDTNDQVRYIIISYPDGSAMASTFLQALPEGLPRTRLPDGELGFEPISFSSNEGRIKEVMVPIDEGLIGYVRVGMTEHKMMSDLQMRCAQVILAVLLVCIAASVLATRYALAFLKPIRKLAFAVKQLDKGNYGIQVPITSQDEIGRLAMIFNEMSVGLRNNIDENNRLVEALQEKEKDRKWLISQLFSVREDEKRCISRELHDESSQSMASILTYLRVLHSRLDTDEQREMLFEIRELTANTLGGLRQLAVDLHPPLLEDLGLITAIEKYLDPIKKTHPELNIELHAQGDFAKLSKQAALICYRTIQEGVANILKHAQAHHVQLRLCVYDENVHLLVADDGVGAELEAVQNAKLNRHLGLVSMKERVELLNGKFELTTGKGKGTKIEISLPLEIEGNEDNLGKDMENIISR